MLMGGGCQRGERAPGQGREEEEAWSLGASFRGRSGLGQRRAKRGSRRQQWSEQLQNREEP